MDGSSPKLPMWGTVIDAAATPAVATAAPTVAAAPVATPAVAVATGPSGEKKRGKNSSSPEVPMEGAVIDAAAAAVVQQTRSSSNGHLPSTSPSSPDVHMGGTALGGSRTLASLACKFRDPKVILSLDLSPLKDLRSLDLSTKRGLMTAVLRVSHFLALNRQKLGAEAKRFQTFSAIVGLTSAGKDVLNAMLSDRDELAVSGNEMVTAANERCTVIHKAEMAADRYTVTFKGQRIYCGDSADAFLAARSKLMEDIRNTDTQDQRGISADPVDILIETGTETWPTQTLNTIGMQGRSQGGDPIFEQINALLNEQREHGGIVIIAHALDQPLDGSALWQDLDVVRELKNGGRGKFKFLYACTKADRYHPDYLDKCRTFEEVYTELFGSFLKVLPQAEPFLTTGWEVRAKERTRKEFGESLEALWASVQSRILSERPEEAHSPWLEKLGSAMGTGKLVQRYQELMMQQGRELLGKELLACMQLASDSLRVEQNGLLEQRQMLRRDGVADNVVSFCEAVEKNAMILRINNIERPSGTDITLEQVEDLSKESRQSFAEEFETLQERYGCSLPTACGGDASEVHSELCNKSVKINPTEYHCFGHRMIRLKSNVNVLANLYQMPEMTKEAIVALQRTSGASNSLDPTHYIYIKALDAVKKIYTRELVPLLTHWVAHLVHESARMSFRLVLTSTKWQLFQDNDRFCGIFLEVIRKKFFTDVKEKIEWLTLRRTPAFAERISVERSLQEENILQVQKVQQWVDQLERLRGRTHSDGDSPDAAGVFQRMLSAVGILSDNSANFKSDVNANPAKHLHPKDYMTLNCDEIEYFKVYGAFCFSYLLQKCVAHFMWEAEAAIDTYFNETGWASEKDLLFKMLWLAAREKARADDKTRPLFENLAMALKKVDNATKCQGLTAAQMVDHGYLRFVEEPVAVDDDDDNPFADMGLANESCSPDLAYKLPAAMMPGYAAPLHDRVVTLCKGFLGEFFDMKQSQDEKLLAKARNIKESYKILNEVVAVLKSAPRN